MTIDIKAEVDAIQQIGAVPKILDVVGRMTGMGFVAIARVTSSQWVCCAVRDNISFGLKEGGELKVETTICNEIRQHGQTVVINDVETDGAFCNHPTPAMYGFRSYISAPIIQSDGTIWGTLCAIDPQPRDLKKPEILGSFQLLGELIAAQLELNQRLEQSQSDLRTSQADLLDERKTAELREQFIGVLGHDLRNPLASVDAGMRVLLRNPDRLKAPEIILGIQKSVLRMAGLVDNIMDFARGRLGGGLTIRRDTKQPLTPVLEQVIAELRSVWPDVAIEAAIDIDEPVDCDRGKMGQLFSNLLGNAITYGDQGQAGSRLRANDRWHVRTGRDELRRAAVRQGDGEPVHALHARRPPEPAGPRARPLHRLADREGAWRHAEGLLNSGRDEIRFRDAAADRLKQPAVR